MRDKITDVEIHELYYDFSRLKNWGLINSKKLSSWIITQKGIDFLNGKISIPMRVYVKDHEVVKVSKKMINIDDNCKLSKYNSLLKNQVS